MFGSYLRYGFSRKNEYHIHSPFMFELYTKVFRERQRKNVDYDLVTRVGKMLDSKRHLPRSRRKLARFFYRYAAYYEPLQVTLFGSVTAMDAAAFALGNPHSRVNVGSSCDFVETLNSFGVINVECVPVDDILKLCCEQRREEVVLVFEGNHKDKASEALWDEICEHPDVVLTLDLYHAGMVLYREGMEKQSFVL